MATPEEVLSVSGLNGLVKRSLEERFPRVTVEGELSRVTRAASGHVYFTLKDAQASVSAVAWSSTARTLRTPLQEGLQVVVRGQVTLYPARGTYQLICNRVEPAGEGAIRQAFLRLKAQLQAEGLLDPESKRALPLLPKCVGLITSATGAALEDFKRSIWDRFPTMPIILSSARVQGEGAPQELRVALMRLLAHGGCDVIVIGRGGGSLEDLSVFNDEALARDISASLIPVVSAVGHEIDVTISDLVADARALTPTAAGGMVVPDMMALEDDLADLGVQLLRALRRHLDQERSRLDELQRRGGVSRLYALLAEKRQALDLVHMRRTLGVRSRLSRAIERASQARMRLERSSPEKLMQEARGKLQQMGEKGTAALGGQLKQQRHRLLERSSTLRVLNPLSVLGRGFAVVRNANSGRILRSAGDPTMESSLLVTFARGDDLLATVDRTRSRTYPEVEDGAAHTDEEDA